MSVLAGRVVTPGGLIEDGVVEVTDAGVIGYVGPAAGWRGEEPKPVGTIAPGYVDIHCHGGGGHSFSSPDPAEIAAAAEHHLGRGTTSLLASLVTAPTAELTSSLETIARLADPSVLPGHAAEKVEEVTGRRTGIVGSHLEGPWLDHGHCGAHDPAYLTEPDVDTAQAWLDAADHTLRMVTIAPELAGADAVIERLKATGVLVGLGHTGADHATFDTALRSLDLALVTHLFNGMEPMHHRHPGPVGASLAALARGAAVVELIADGVHLAPETVRMVFNVDRGGDRIVLVSDAMVAAGMPDGGYRLGSLEVQVTDGQALTVPPTGGRRSLAGSTAHLADVVRHCITVAGVDPVRAVVAATTTPSRLLGLTDRGSVEAGLRADLVTLDDEWRVTRVMRGGGWVA